MNTHVGRNEEHTSVSHRGGAVRHPDDASPGEYLLMPEKLGTWINGHEASRYSG